MTTTAIEGHAALLELDWDSGTVGYGLEGTRGAALYYEPLLLSAGAIARELAPSGAYSYPTLRAELLNFENHFTGRLLTEEIRNRTVRLKIARPFDDTPVTVFEGRVDTWKAIDDGERIRISCKAGRRIDLEGEVRGALPLLEPGNFPNMPRDRRHVDAVPLIYGRLLNPTGEALDDQACCGALEAPAIDLSGAVGTESFTLGSPNLRRHRSYEPEGINATGMYFKADGTKLFAMIASTLVAAYDLSTPWNVGTAKLDATFSTTTENAIMNGLWFSPDGLRMFMAGRSTNQRVYDYDLSTAWDISTAVANTSIDVSSEDSQPYGVCFSPDGTEMFVAGGANNDVFGYALSTAWDISTASYGSNTISITGGSALRDLQVSADGAHLFICDSTTVRHWEMSTPFDLTSATQTTSWAPPSGAGYAGVFIRADGTRLFIANNSTEEIEDYDLSFAAWDTNATVGTGTTWLGLAHAPTLGSAGRWVAIGSGGTYQAMYSDDGGETWTNTSVPAALTWNDVAWVPELGLFVAVAFGGTNPCMTSADGISWTQRTMTNSSWTGIAWSAELGRLVAVSAASGLAHYSEDGINWTAGTIPGSSYTWQGVVWAAELGLFVAICDTGTDGARVMTSPDGKTWSLRYSAGDSAWWFEIAWSPQLGALVAVGADSGTPERIMISTDGLNWEKRPIPDVSFANFLAVCWCPDFSQFVAIGSDNSGEGYAFTSGDARTWTSWLLPQSAGIVRRCKFASVDSAVIAVGDDSVLGDVSLKSPAYLNEGYKFAVNARYMTGDDGAAAQMGSVYVGGNRVPGSRTISTASFNGHTIAFVQFGVDQSQYGAVRFYGGGVADGDTGNTPILNPVEAKAHFLQTYTALVSADFDSTIQTAAESAADGNHLAADNLNNVAPAALGALVAGRQKLSEALEKFDAAAGAFTYQTRAGKFATLVRPLGAIPAATFDVTDAGDVISLEFGPNPSVRSALFLQFGARYERNTAGASASVETSRDKNGLQFTRTHEYPIFGEAEAVFGSDQPAVESWPLEFVRRAASAVNIARAVGEFYRSGARLIEYRLPIQWFNKIEIGDYGTLTHWKGEGPVGVGWQSQAHLVMGIEVAPRFSSSAGSGPTIQVKAFVRAPGVVHYDDFVRTPATGLGSDYSESEDNAAALQIVTSSAYGQADALKLTAGYYGVALLDDDDTGANQLASLRILYTDLMNDGAAAGAFGVVVRGSGTYSSFTGYALLVTGTPGIGTPQTLTLREYNAEDISSAGAGTDLATATLPEPLMPNHAGSGEVLELRVYGSTLTVFYWSDDPRRSGKMLETTDATIASGKAGIINRAGDDAIAAGFYVRAL